MIPQDDPLLKLLKEIGTDEGLYIVGLNPYADETGEAIRVLERFGHVEVRPTEHEPYEYLATLTEGGRAWLVAATRENPAVVLLKAFERASTPDDDLLLRPY